MAPGAPPPSSEEVWRLLGELDAWRQQVPRELPAPFPQHSNDRNARALSLNPQQQASPIQVYHCFNCGVSLLQCLALQPTVLAPRRTVRAIVACSSALAIYSKSLATASIFLELFEKLADGFLGGDENEDPPKHPDLRLRSVLQDIIASAPAEMPR
ncbi:hypothetical protein NW762_005414 [Fusarium torreyae]|uniref:Uncharacterized protein n=1 Tax=Fusarium torreyae TaxID=1237075 RepID=A0A9W8S2R4_9HYPO|nr:hypothetical protein NW762_005414 [Fusarium torreyae]